ncbi:Hydrolase 4 domain-containing protein [Citrus sinensis]|nr:Hydrolase 4 domain-containing protein [Citrus sinensis]KAH9800044.1 Hydrolase 4 domain-containing protein [Citrus sinensis]
MYWAINLQRFSLIRRRHHRRFVISHHVRDPADSELSARFPAGPGVVIPNSHGEKLVGILHETGSKQLVIVCHGFQSTKDRIPMVNLAAALEREGISAFRFDFSGNGESEGSFLYGNYRREAEDLRAIVQDFCAKGRVITAIIGHSKGGNAVLLYASKYNDISIVINISGRFNLKRGIEGRLGLGYLQRIKQNGFIDVRNKKGKLEYRVTQESLMDRLSTDIHAACHMICQDCRVLTIHGTKDKMVPAEDALEFDKFIPNHKLHIIEGADHEFTSHQDELASLVIQFIKANYQKDGPTSKRADGTIDSRM